MDTRYASPPSTSPLSQNHVARMARMQDGRPVDTWDDGMYDPLSKSPSARRQSTIPIPDLSTLTMGVPEMVIADAANDPTATSPSARRRVPVTARKRRGTQDEAVKVVDLGAMMASEGVTLIEEFRGEQGERECVPGIDTKRPSIGVTRPSDEDKRMRVEGWAGQEMGESSERRRTVSEQDSKRKLGNFTPLGASPIARYYNPRKESDFSTTSSASGHASSTSNDYPLIYSPQDSPPLDARAYQGTILDLVSDPQEIREYRNLERRKEMDRRESGNSASSGAASTSASRSGSVNLGRPDQQGYARKGSWGESPATHHARLHHAHSPRTNWTSLGAQPLYVDPMDVSSPPSRRALPEVNTSLSLSPHHSGNHHPSSYATPTSPLSPASPLASRQHLFHPDLHPVADHHVPGLRSDPRDMLADLNNISQSDTALYVHSSDPPDIVGSGDQPTVVQKVAAAVAETLAEETPSSSETVRPPLVSDSGRAKAKTVADFRTIDDLEAEE